MSIKIALAGNPNCGKTTLFNNLTGSNQYVGNWPGVTVEKKEGKLKGEKDVIIQDLPGIYSLSPYTLEEVVSRTYLVKEKPDAILNIIDGTNIERNLYLTTQLIELGIPVVMAVNMIDLVRKNGDKIDLKKLSAELGCQAVEISALKGEGTEAAAKAAMAAAKAGKAGELPHVFTGSVEHAIAHIDNYFGPIIILSGLVQGLGFELIIALKHYKKFDRLTMIQGAVICSVLTLIYNLFISGYSKIAVPVLAILLVVRIISAIVFDGFITPMLADGLVKAGVLKGYAVAQGQDMDLED